MKQAVAFVAVVFVVVFLKYTDARCSNVSGYVYIMQERTTTGGSGLYYKVGGVEGDSKKVDTRRGNLQTGNPRKLVVKERFAVSNCRDAEKACQHAVSHYEVKGFGGGTEWFEVRSNSYLEFRNSIKNVAGTFPITSVEDINGSLRDFNRV